MRVSTTVITTLAAIPAVVPLVLNFMTDSIAVVCLLHEIINSTLEKQHNLLQISMNVQTLMVLLHAISFA